MEGAVGVYHQGLVSPRSHAQRPEAGIFRAGVGGVL